METYCAPPERADEATLQQYFNSLSDDPFIDTLMRISNGFFAVLNEHRQIITLNDTFLKMMGVESARQVLGLRLGEYLKCGHANEIPDGCGTTPWCTTCGSTMGIMASLRSGTPVDDTCAVSVEIDGKVTDLFLQVRCCPIVLQDTRFLLFFLQDISAQQQRASLERAFFHDISNILQGVIGKSKVMLIKNGPDPELSELHNMVLRMAQEISLQKSLSATFSHTYQPLYCRVGSVVLLRELEEVFRNHPLAEGRLLNISLPPHDISVTTDPGLVNRILVNMVTNALEASDQGDAVTVFVEPAGTTVTFCVRNRGVIPEAIARRIFQRNFSTKNAIGRGLGTYCMKFFGETVLGGRVCFASTGDEGTIFRLELPCD